VAALAVGAALLWPTAVPGDLALPEIDDGDVFGADLVARAERYRRFLYADWVLAQVALLATLWLYARRGAAFTRESAAGPIGTGMLLGMLGLGIVWLVQLPFGLAAHWWDRRYELSEQGYLEWAVDGWAVLAAEFLAISVALLVVMALARRFGDHWWLPGAAVFALVATLFTFVAPYLYATDPLEDESLLASAAEFERELGISDIPIRVEDVSDATDRANAFAFGMGPSRRVVFWDTMLQDPFDAGEQRVVLAHELAHHSEQHLPEGLAWFTIVAIPGAWILMRVTRRRGGLGRPEAVPLALLVVVVLQLALSPLENGVSRRLEAEADWKALEVTREPEALERLMVGFAETSLGDPSPPGWIRVLVGTHPSLGDRVAMARAWAARNR